MRKTGSGRRRGGFCLLEDKTGLDRSGLIALLDRSFGEITRKVAGQEIYKTQEPVGLSGERNFLMVHTNGDYEAIIALTAERTFFREAAGAMKRGGIVQEAEIEIYVMEYFNIFCGRFLSGLNSCLHTRARFAIPRFAGGEFMQRTEEECGRGKVNLQLFYRSGYGTMRLDGLHLPCAD